MLLASALFCSPSFPFSVNVCSHPLVSALTPPWVLPSIQSQTGRAGKEQGGSTRSCEKLGTPPHMRSQQQCHSSNPSSAKQLLGASHLETSAQMFTLSKAKRHLWCTEWLSLITLLSKGSFKSTQPSEGAGKALLTLAPGSAVPAPQGCAHPTATLTPSAATTQWSPRARKTHQELDQEPAKAFRSSQAGCASPHCRSSLQEWQQGRSGGLPGTEGSEVP